MADNKALQLVQVVSKTGMIGTDLENVVKMQDILGRSTRTELVEAAEYDKAAFLRITRHTWSVADQFTFYNRHLNDKMDELEKENHILREQLVEVQNKMEQIRQLAN